ncbi:MAG: hypothetical protein ACTHWW_11475 [Arthrobacter sp.]|uniref:hypothetical protein n=1 Tax=unclassified Arthrobacter TaxID=235627 RepID=UPI003FB68813
MEQHSATPQQSNHQNEHPGCKALFPWLRSCRTWKSTPYLLERARSEVRGIPADMWDNHVSLMREHRDMFTSRSGHWSTFIAWVAGWQHYEIGFCCLSAANLGRALGETALEVDHRYVATSCQGAEVSGPRLVVVDRSFRSRRLVVVLGWRVFYDGAVRLIYAD